MISSPAFEHKNLSLEAEAALSHPREGGFFMRPAASAPTPRKTRIGMGPASLTLRPHFLNSTRETVASPHPCGVTPCIGLASPAHFERFKSIIDREHPMKPFGSLTAAAAAALVFFSSSAFSQTADSAARQAVQNLRSRRAATIWNYRLPGVPNYSSIPGSIGSGLNSDASALIGASFVGNGFNTAGINTGGFNPTGINRVATTGNFAIPNQTPTLTTGFVPTTNPATVTRTPVNTGGIITSTGVSSATNPFFGGSNAFVGGANPFSTTGTSFSGFVDPFNPGLPGSVSPTSSTTPSPTFVDPFNPQMTRPNNPGDPFFVDPWFPNLSRPSGFPNSNSTAGGTFNSTDGALNSASTNNANVNTGTFTNTGTFGPAFNLPGNFTTTNTPTQAPNLAFKFPNVNGTLNNQAGLTANDLALLNNQAQFGTQSGFDTQRGLSNQTRQNFNSSNSRNQLGQALNRTGTLNQTGLARAQNQNLTQQQLQRLQAARGLRSGIRGAATNQATAAANQASRNAAFQAAAQARGLGMQFGTGTANQAAALRNLNQLNQFSPGLAGTTGAGVVNRGAARFQPGFGTNAAAFRGFGGFGGMGAAGMGAGGAMNFGGVGGMSGGMGGGTAMGGGAMGGAVR